MRRTSCFNSGSVNCLQEARLRDATFEGVAAAVAGGVARVVDGTCGTARWPKLLAFCHTQYIALGGALGCVERMRCGV